MFLYGYRLKWMVAKSLTKQEQHQENGTSDGVIVYTEALFTGKEDEGPAFWVECPHLGF